MNDIVDEIIAAADQASKWEPPNHPQYIEGALYLTQQQWDSVLEAFPWWAKLRWAVDGEDYKT